MRYLNQLEPNSFIEHFLQYPPEYFVATQLPDSTPTFTTHYNLLTTLDFPLQRKIATLPLFKYWRKWLTPYTCFVGTTVSEYTLAPNGIQPKEWVLSCKQQLANSYAFLIIKDIPLTSPLLSEEENTYAQSCINAAKETGFIVLQGQALAFVPIDFCSLDEYMQRFSKATRKNMRRKLKSLETLNISITRTGDSWFNDEQVVSNFYHLYENVYLQSEIHFDKLTFGFFKALLQSADNNGTIMIYRYEGKIIGYNICFVEANRLVDKYVGFEYPAAREHNLYFVSWFVNLDYAIKHQISTYIAGWTDPEVKKSLGALFTFTYHAVHIRNPFIRILLKPFTFLFESDTKRVGEENNVFPSNT